ncbi:cytochrome c biogenesis protein ResB [Planococcus kocurii]|uniref:cytochrome c biogenesis protein ResB n=1 Tax=Planococcus TaxID=1372 RepID=UPI000C34BE58|nr:MULTISPECIES: cytochrome c biogenesis protein ResB [unclassified Planococcus (in: firmicutes)]AUD14936.1 cytochrome C biogenesis protein [Planococcus sp. MB-3u-03]KAA0956050.1 cytochrome C biogenesis protein [Planococcus sp. ANT_H30]PKG47197.1 cytochrome C biogenesis protein [Planococcus sp. Urea-trap-24]PKG87607.1 cytochrome C biogenesis protein [Planococcus sp. Urea-3u-39]PKH35399.1 cytochrome C biogenesis protein [Planococcus sp. MB-3u-09]
MENVQCQCGHTNPPGTKLCESCGRSLTEKDQNSKLVDMRYEGTARRSQTYNKSIIDKIWNFFSSVKVGVSIIVVLLVAAAIGTILPQQAFVPASTEATIQAYYADTYGSVGRVYHALGFHDLYSSYWFIALVGMLAISLVIASLDRFVPLYKSLKNQRVLRHPSFMDKQRIYGSGPGAEDALEKAETKLKELKYTVRTEKNGLLAEKGRFSRWGPYVNHIGLIIFLFGVMLRMMPGFYVDETLWLREGETRAIPEVPGYYLENKNFKLETYTGEGEDAKFGEAIDRVGTVVKNYQTDIVLYQEPEDSLPGATDNLEVVQEYPIRVNQPLKFDGYAVYQMDYKLNELKAMTFALTNKETEESLGELTIDLINPDALYELETGSTVELLGYYPDFSGFEDGEPQTATPLPNNPGFLVELTTPETPEGETSFITIQNTVEPLGENQYKLTFQNADTRNVSGLTVRKDSTLPILGLGGLIFMIGVAQGMYFNHRRFWIQQKADGTILLAGHTNKNWFGLKKDLDRVVDSAKLPAYTDQQDEIDKKEKAEKEGESSS